MGQVMAVALHLLAGMGQVSAKQAVSGAAIDGVTVEDAFRQARRLFEGIHGDGQLQGLIEDLGILRPALKDPLHEGAGQGEVALVPVMAEQHQIAREVIRVQFQTLGQLALDHGPHSALQQAQPIRQPALDQEWPGRAMRSFTSVQNV